MITSIEEEERRNIIITTKIMIIITTITIAIIDPLPLTRTIMIMRMTIRNSLPGLLLMPTNKIIRTPQGVTPQDQVLNVGIRIIEGIAVLHHLNRLIVGKVHLKRMKTEIGTIIRNHTHPTRSRRISRQNHPQQTIHQGGIIIIRDGKVNPIHGMRVQ